MRHLLGASQGKAAETPAGVTLAWSFVDSEYNRTSFTFCGHASSQARDQPCCASSACLCFPDERARRRCVHVCADERAQCVQLTSHVVDLACEAIGLVDMRQHEATHPRLGAVDHISCHPVTERPQAHAATQAALDIAAALSAREARVSILMYGQASASLSKLRDIRRECGASLARIWRSCR